MEIVEFWYVRRTLLIEAAVIAVLVLLASVLTGHVHVSGDVQMPTFHGFPLSAMAPVALFFAAICASILGAQFRRLDDTLELIWTRPIARRALAWRFIGIDLLGILVALVLGYAMIGSIAARAGIVPALDPEAGVAFVLALGVAAMWYGLTLALSTALRGGLARSVTGLLWPVALVALALGAQTPPATIVHALARWIDVVNPLAYMQISFSRHGAGLQAMWPLQAELRAAIVWLFAAAFCAIATELWARREI